MSTLPANIETYLSKPISQICPFSIGLNNNQNHCAHFVSHIMGYELPGPTCKNFSWADSQKKDKSATLRVDDLFKASAETGLLVDKPVTLTECLIFVTLATNVKKMGAKWIMGNHPRKHIGILSKGKVWNYGNTHNKVTADTLELFKTKFTHAYKTSGTTVVFYYGKFL